jgi:hypothetical protein
MTTLARTCRASITPDNGPHSHDHTDAWSAAAATATATMLLLLAHW